MWNRNVPSSWHNASTRVCVSRSSTPCHTVRKNPRESLRQDRETQTDTTRKKQQGETKEKSVLTTLSLPRTANKPDPPIKKDTPYVVPPPTAIGVPAAARSRKERALDNQKQQRFVHTKCDHALRCYSQSCLFSLRPPISIERKPRYRRSRCRYRLRRHPLPWQGPRLSR